MLAEAGLVEEASSLIYTHCSSHEAGPGPEAQGNEEWVGEERVLS